MLLVCACPVIDMSMQQTPFLDDMSERFYAMVVISDQQLCDVSPITFPCANPATGTRMAALLSLPTTVVAQLNVSLDAHLLQILLVFGDVTLVTPLSEQLLPLLLLARKVTVFFHNILKKQETGGMLV